MRKCKNSLFYKFFILFFTLILCQTKGYGEAIEKKNIVISRSDTKYLKNDLVLITDGFQAKAIVNVLSDAKVVLIFCTVQKRTKLYIIVHISYSVNVDMC